MNLESSPIWRGTDKPGGAPFYAPIPASQQGVECPKCRLGSLSIVKRRRGELVRCDECGGSWERMLFVKLYPATKLKP